MTEPKEHPIIEVRDLTLRFGDVEVLSGVSFAVTAGETVCILGGSGGGKTTLLRCMFGALRPTAGRVIIEGRDLTRMRDRELDEMRRRFGVMFQSGALLNSLTVAENVALPIRFHTRLDAATVDTMVKMKLHQVDLLHASDRCPAALSGGMQKRAAVARALALDPRIIFYDEPSAGLDPIATSRIDRLVNRLKDSLGMTSVVVTHVMESVQRIADRVIMLSRGKVILDGDLDALMDSEDPLVVQFRTGDLTGPGSTMTSTEDYLKDLLL
jgi:phospholipid/cholesterol/gamma-HCH transport system ATP-binding protein